MGYVSAILIDGEVDKDKWDTPYRASQPYGVHMKPFLKSAQKDHCASMYIQLQL